jgi:hypothetical protein
MKARKLLNGASVSFGPAALKVAGRAFDEAWADIAGNYSGAQQIEAARLKLATAILSVATDASRDVEELKRAALARMAQHYRC